MILLRNFYVGISSWNRYVLDTLKGGNFLGTSALEACTLIESLVGVPPIHVVKTNTPFGCTELGLEFRIAEFKPEFQRLEWCRN
jgi:hypothetical protein